MDFSETIEKFERLEEEQIKVISYSKYIYHIYF